MALSDVGRAQQPIVLTDLRALVAAKPVSADPGRAAEMERTAAAVAQ